MKRSHGRRLVPCLQALATLATVASLVHCSGGELPPPAGSDPVIPPGGTSGTVDAGGGGAIVTILDVDMTQGIRFGENGFTNCGTTAGAKTITLKNNLGEVVNFEAEMVVGKERFDLTPAAGAIPVRGETPIQISPKPIPSEANVAEDFYAGTLEIRLPRRGSPMQVPLHQTARGAIVTMGAPSYALGQVAVGASASLPVTFTNAGNMEVTATLAVGTPVYSIGGGSTLAVPLAPGKAESRPLALAPVAAGTLGDTLAISYNPGAVHCKAPPTSATITGTGTTGVGISPGTLDFGDVNCGATAPEQILTITSTIAMKFSAALDKGGTSSFTLKDDGGANVTQGAEIDVPAATAYKLHVIPKPIPPVSPITANFYGDSLRITTNVPGSTEKVIPVQMGAKGAILAFNPTTGISVTGADINVANTTQFQLVNSGNLQIPYQLKLVDPNGQPFSGPAGTFGIGNQTTVTGNANIGTTNLVLNTRAPATYSTTIDGALELTVTTSADAAMCADLPGRYNVTSKTNAGTSITLTPPALQFGEVLCGSTAPPQNVTVKSVVSTNFTPDLVKGANSPFTLKNGGADITLGQPIPITPGTDFVITVVPKPMPARPLLGTQDNAFGDVMTIKSPVDATKNYDIRQTAKGAILLFSPLIMTAPGTFILRNNGNQTADYTLTATGPWSTNIDTGSAPRGDKSGVLSGGGGDGSLKVTVNPATTTLCADLPGDLIIDVP